MEREILPISDIAAWAKVNGVFMDGVAIKSSNNGNGSAVFATEALSAYDGREDTVIAAKWLEDCEEEAPLELLMVIPKDLILSLEAVERYAETDKELREVLEASGECTRTARSAILIFLLVQITHSAIDVTEKVGDDNPWAEYVKFLPSSYPLPTFWSEAERALLVGVSLNGALQAKLKSLEREFEELRSATEDIPWCKRQWWDGETGRLTIEDWKIVDAMFRSRAMDLPDVGHVMVPCVDMANHASGEETVAGYGVNIEGDAVLRVVSPAPEEHLYRRGEEWLKISDALIRLLHHKTIWRGEEVTIDYGEEKGACEMLFSYGFIEENMQSAKAIFLDLHMEDDDPLRQAKVMVSNVAPGFKICTPVQISKWEMGADEDDVDNDWNSPASTVVDIITTVSWDGAYVWLGVVNEEDGLELKMVETDEDQNQLQMFWKGKRVETTEELYLELRKDTLFDVFQLRAAIVLQARVDDQLHRLDSSVGLLQDASDFANTDAEVLRSIRKLRELEKHSLGLASKLFEEQVARLLQTDVVRNYMATVQAETPGINSRATLGRNKNGPSQNSPLLLSEAEMKVNQYGECVGDSGSE